MKSSKYHGVYVNTFIPKDRSKAAIERNKRYNWYAHLVHKGRRFKKVTATEREAAIYYDRWVLELGLDKPLNILKPKP